jgi:hypothetical protein
MNLPAAVDHIGALLDRFALTHPDYMLDLAMVGRVKRGVPPQMWAGEVDEDGWVNWRMLPATVSADDVDLLERGLDLVLPVHLRAYLMARSHFFEETHSHRYGGQQDRRYGQLLSLPRTPSVNPLAAFRDVHDSWAFLRNGGYLPFGDWGDGWGPLCLDLLAEPGRIEDAPVVWFDHEVLTFSDSTTRERSALEPLAQPLYESFMSCVEDAFHE